ncbi:hypothetical protein K437DRAFT_274125 [Tilletiaria anomala UBC 951]|uniref:P-loop containing nucleoside triphosphate hydrolase protein n=1 Tax=Tilletiaria anomala (strain ATCC 24038 / CBS 436.72 / UBC 951) TaxID=1037660 RepID=A0A066VWT3_TILAU|nr:uncharacterized protein K437DRAFT_274125 [Tilletiaria anomala UBC 951]KDN45926.1 hypothetical protein K437DRAFT_274125 [Tilletiaria anomala UBC 951]
MSAAANCISSPRKSQKQPSSSGNISSPSYKTLAERARLRTQPVLRASSSGSGNSASIPPISDVANVKLSRTAPGGIFSSIDQVIDVDALDDDFETTADRKVREARERGSSVIAATPSLSSGSSGSVQRPSVRLSKLGERRGGNESSPAKKSGGVSMLVGAGGARVPTQLLNRPKARIVTLSDSDSDEGLSSKKAKKQSYEQAKTNDRQQQKIEKPSYREEGDRNPGRNAQFNSPAPPPAPPQSAYGAVAAAQQETLANGQADARSSRQPLAAPLLPAPAPAALQTPLDPLCIGMISVPILCLSGVPASLQYEPTIEGQGHKELEDIDPIYDKSRWPSQTSFWAEKGYRPAVLELVPNATYNAILQDEQTRGSVNMLASKARAQEIKVALVVPPALRSEAQAGSGVIVKEHNFGVIAEKYCSILDPLLRAGQLKVESRVPLIQRSRSGNYMHTIDMLAFCSRKDKDIISTSFILGGIVLSPVDSFNAADYPGRPTYDNPHALAYPTLFNTGIRRAPGATGSAGEFGTIDKRDRDLTEDEKKEQVNSVYSSLTHAEDVEEVAQSPLIKTPLFPHQRKALAFLLMREKERSFEAVMRKMREKEDQIKQLGKEQLKRERERKARKERGEDVTDDETVAAQEQACLKEPQRDIRFADAEDKAEEDGGTVSLWKPIKNTVGGIKAYLNVVTRSQVRERPEVCRGAILADDMGLGKTISIIALLAHTREDAISFASKRPTGKSDPALPFVRSSAVSLIALSDSTSSDSEPEFGGIGLPRRGKKGKGKSAVGKGKERRSSVAKGIDGTADAGAKKFNDTLCFAPTTSPRKKTRQEKAKEQEAIRLANLDVRSRATLIICPMSIISNWEEQVKEHWGYLKRPKIYIYHGAQRSKEPGFIANHDVVLTTYSTLAIEFSNQTIWADHSVKEHDCSDSEFERFASDSDKSDHEMPTYDAEGKPVESTTHRKRKKRAKKKVISKSGDSPNPLQRIEWFRIVLDEAHIIKDSKTWQSKAVCNLSAQRRTALTGTPVQNRVDDLYALVRFLRLDPFADRANWNYWCNMSRQGLTLKTAKHGSVPLDTVSLARVQTIMKFLTLRRTKETKDPHGKPILQLPPKYQRTVVLDFGDVEKARYNAMHQMYREDFEEMLRGDTVQQNYATILVEILYLRMTCDHPDMVDMGKDIRRSKDGDYNVQVAIAEDGITRERATRFFRILRDNGASECGLCNREITMGLDAAPDELDDFGGGSAGKGRGKGKAQPKTGDDEEAELKAVVTKCQHLSCSECFANYAPADSGWPRPCANAPGGMCPECAQPLSLLLEVVQLERTDFEELDRNADLDSLPDESRQLDDDDDFKPDRKKHGRLAEEAAKFRKQTLNEALKARPDLSTKIHALVTDLLQFSVCNPHSKLYDPHAPRLDHRALTEEEIAIEMAAAKAAIAVKSDKGPLNISTSGMQSAGSSNQVRGTIEAAAPKGTEVHKGDHPAPKMPPVETVKVVEWLPKVNLDGSITQYRPIKSIVFSQWTRMLDKVQKCLIKTGIRCVRLDGTMTRGDRLATLNAFKSDEGIEVMLISLKAGGFGLNLVQAARAYLVDPYWNPGVEMQGLDRIHRLGQTRPVITTKFIMSHSIEENLLELQARKMQMAESVGQKRQVSPQQRRNQRQHDLQTLFRMRSPDAPAA